MKTAELRALIRNSDQSPIRLRMDDGKAYTVNHPDFAMVADTAIILGSRPGQNFGDADFIVCHFDHLARIEHLKSKKAA